jgi:hypothetical protein
MFVSLTGTVIGKSHKPTYPDTIYKDIDSSMIQFGFHLVLFLAGIGQDALIKTVVAFSI